MKRHLRLRFLPVLPACLLACGVLRADIIILKSGEKVDGKILSENDTSINVEYLIPKTKNIKDVRVINKTDIKELTRFTPSQTEIEERGLRKLLPTRDLMTPSDYESIIQDQLRTFAAKYPGTPETKEVEQIIATLTEEKAKVLSGQVKFEGRWLDEAAAKREAYNIEAYRLRLAMKAKEAEKVDGNFRDALREFERIRLQYPGSVQFVQAIPEVLGIMEKYEKRLSAMAAEYPQINQQRDTVKKSTLPNDQATKVAIEQEEREFKALRDLERKPKSSSPVRREAGAPFELKAMPDGDAKVRGMATWGSVYKYDLLSIQDAQTAITKERLELKRLDLAALQTENESLSALIGHLSVGNAAEAETLMTKLRAARATLVNKNEFARAEKEFAVLDKKRKDQLKAQKAAVATATDASTQNGKTSDNPVAEALKAKEEAKKKKDAEAREKKAKADAARAEANARAAALPKEEPSMMEKIIAYTPYIGGALLVVLIIAMVLGKKKKDDDE